METNEPSRDLFAPPVLSIIESLRRAIDEQTKPGIIKETKLGVSNNSDISQSAIDPTVLAEEFL